MKPRITDIAMIYIYIYCHPQTDCFIVSQLISVARHAGWLKLQLKPTQLYVRLSILPLSLQATNISLGIIRHYVVAFVCLHFALYLYIYIYVCVCVCVKEKLKWYKFQQISAYTWPFFDPKFRSSKYGIYTNNYGIYKNLWAKLFQSHFTNWFTFKHWWKIYDKRVLCTSPEWK